jgi:hypothetical protein
MCGDAGGELPEPVRRLGMQVGTSEHLNRKLGMKALEAGRNAEAYALLRPFALAGDAQVQAHLSGIMMFGQHRFADAAAYNAWFKGASQEEQAAFTHDLQADIDEAIGWLQSLSDQGIGPASHNLAMAFLMGRGSLAPEERRSKVIELLARAREQGFAFFGGEEADEGYLQTLEGYAADQGIGMPWDRPRC